MSKINDFVASLTLAEFDELAVKIANCKENQAKIAVAANMLQEAKDYCQAQGLRILVGFPEDFSHDVYEICDLGAKLIVDVN